jgi:hypothetical protein
MRLFLFSRARHPDAPTVDLSGARDVRTSPVDTHQRGSRCNHYLDLLILPISFTVPQASLQRARLNDQVVGAKTAFAK